MELDAYRERVFWYLLEGKGILCQVCECRLKIGKYCGCYWCYCTNEYSTPRGAVLACGWSDWKKK